MALSRHITNALLMRMWHAKNHFDPLLRTQYTLNFSTKYAVNTKYIKVFTRIAQNARNQRTSDGFVASDYMRMAHAHPCACAITEITMIRFVEHNLSSISDKICSNKHHKYQNSHPNYAKCTEPTHIRWLCRIRLNAYGPCACAITKITTIRFVEHNLSLIFRRNMFLNKP